MLLSLSINHCLLFSLSLRLKEDGDFPALIYNHTGSGHCSRKQFAGVALRNFYPIKLGSVSPWLRLPSRTPISEAFSLPK